MAADPLIRLVLRATSVADDVGFVALHDLGAVMSGKDYRLIGGHMVTTLVARWQLGAELYRQTQDTDLGVPPVAVQEPTIIDALLDLGYQRRAGNRFGRPVDDIPVRLIGLDAPPPEATIDILIAGYRTKLRNDVKFKEHLVTTEVPGLSTALKRPPIGMSLQLHRLNGQLLDVDVTVADEVSALVLKAHASRVRAKATDIVDIWRCLEICNAANITPTTFTGPDAPSAATRVRELFSERSGHGMRGLLQEQRLAVAAANERYTRISALVRRVIG
jgi:hypothetical protein